MPTVVLCKPKLLPLKSVTLEKMEKMQKEAQEQVKEQERQEKLNSTSGMADGSYNEYMWHLSIKILNICFQNTRDWSIGQCAFQIYWIHFKFFYFLQRISYFQENSYSECSIPSVPANKVSDYKLLDYRVKLYVLVQLN